ncbi:MAG: hypothetical protein ACI9J2_000461 [Saprospiraceae bacterium]|jgi:hypothetical protein
MSHNYHGAITIQIRSDILSGSILNRTDNKNSLAYKSRAKSTGLNSSHASIKLCAVKLVTDIT